ncbi:MAG: hypothetical protein ACUVTG_16515 [Candidatus Oleimicrobiaceae bacterium]
MESTQLPERFGKPLSQARNEFTALSFRYFQSLIAGILLRQPKKVVTTAVRLANVERRFCTVDRPVSQYCWEPRQLKAALVKVFYLFALDR